MKTFSRNVGIVSLLLSYPGNIGLYKMHESDRNPVFLFEYELAFYLDSRGLSDHTIEFRSNSTLRIRMSNRNPEVDRISCSDSIVRMIHSLFVKVSISYNAIVLPLKVLTLSIIESSI
jgi:hypothetical protein